MTCKWFGVVCFAGSLATAGVITSDPNLPPNVGGYVSTGGVHACYISCATVDLTSLFLSGFSSVTRVSIASNEFETFNSTLTGMLSLSGGPFNPVLFTGNEQTETFGKVGNTTGTFAAEMLSLNLSGGGVMIRESPTLASTGQTAITDQGGGLFRIDSFFDVFTELSLDGGQTWIPNQNFTTHLDLQVAPEPAAWGLVFSGLLLTGTGQRLFRSRKPASFLKAPQHFRGSMR